MTIESILRSEPCQPACRRRPWPRRWLRRAEDLSLVLAILLYLVVQSAVTQAAPPPDTPATGELWPTPAGPVAPVVSAALLTTSCRCHNLSRLGVKETAKGS